MIYTCATTFYMICYLILHQGCMSHQASVIRPTDNTENSTYNLMTVKKSLIVASEPSSSSGFVVSNFGNLEKPIHKFEVEKNQSFQNVIQKVENSTNVLPEISNTSLERWNNSSDGVHNMKMGEIRVQTNTTNVNFTASPYLGSIPDEYVDKFRINHGVFTKNSSRGGNKQTPFGIGSVSEPIFFNAVSRPVTNIPDNRSTSESLGWDLRGYKYNQKQRNQSSNGPYPDVKPEESINSFPYHYEGGEHGLPGRPDSYSGYTDFVTNKPEGSYQDVQRNQGVSLNNLNNEDYSRVPVSPPPWMVPPPLHHHDVGSKVRFPYLNIANEKPIRFEENIESVVFTTELPRRGQLEAPLSINNDLYSKTHGQAYEVHSYGSTHKMSTMSQALKFLATIVPLGLFVAALTPAVVNVNATQGVFRRRPESSAAGGREVSDRLPLGAATSGLEAEQCDLREVCEAAIGSTEGGVVNNVPQGTIEERVYSIIANKSPKTALTTYALDELFSVIRRKSCSSFACSSLSQETTTITTLTSTTTDTHQSVAQETSSAPKKIKRKKKKIPPVT